MTPAFLKASLALWQRRVTYRKRKLAIVRKHDHADDHLAPSEVRQIQKWKRLLEAAEANVSRRRRQIAAAKPRESAGQRICDAAERAAANYRRNPGAYHYLAGGTPNTVVMQPTPRTWRSDCSQFAVNIYREAGVPCPGSGTYEFSNTDSISAGGRITRTPGLGALGLYGTGRGRTHHVEIRVGRGRFIGHGSAPIDSQTPGLPNFYLQFT